MVRYLLTEVVLMTTACVLSPLIAVQGMYLRRTVPRLPEPQGERQGVVGSGPLLRLLIIGDSAGAGVGVSHQSEALLGQLLSFLQHRFEVHWTLQAYTGATTQDTLDWLGEQPAEQFDLVITSLGVNDLTGLVSLQRWLREQKSLVRILRDKFQARHIYLSEVPPMWKFPALPQPVRACLGGRARNFSAALHHLFGAVPGCRVVPLNFPFGAQDSMASDGFHPGAPLYALWGKNVALAVLEDFSD